jgi:putative polyketide hydroxylase
VANSSLPSATAVLIVGGGPVGLSLSLLLSQLGIDNTLVERHPGTSIHPRARGLNVRTMEIFRSLGLASEISARGKTLAGNHYMLSVETLAGREYARQSVWSADAPTDQLSPEQQSHCAQDELEPLLLAHVGANAHFNHELLELEQDAEEVTATIVDRRSSQRHTLTSQFVVGCDGWKSRVRECIDVALRGPGVMGDFLNIYFRADLRALVAERPFILCAVRNANVSGLLLPVNNTDRWLLNVSRPTTHEPHSLVSLAIGEEQPIDVDILSTLEWTAAAQVADRLQVGRVFLAGDAAHVMPPAGGFGMNTGIHDAHNLAWKLAHVLNGHAAPSLLDSYEAERLPVGWFTTHQAALRMGAMGLAGSLREAGDLAMRYRGGGRWADDEADYLAVALGYRYDDAPHSLEMRALSGEPGTRAPHVWLADGRSTLDLFTDRYTLLLGPAARLTSSLPSAVCVQRLTHAACTSYGIEPDGASLVRPDGFVAWRGTDPAFGIQSISSEMSTPLPR